MRPVPMTKFEAHKRGEVAVLVGSASAGKGSGFMKGAGVQQLIDTLTDGQASSGVLSLDVRVSAHLARELHAPLQFVDFLLPTRREFAIITKMAEIDSGTTANGFAFRQALGLRCCPAENG